VRTVTVREFRDHASEWLRSHEPVLVVSQGEVVGFFFPSPEASLPLELKRELFPAFSEQTRQALEREGVSEEEVLADFEAFRSSRG